MSNSNESTTEQETPLMVNARLIQAELTVDINGNSRIELCRKIEIEYPDGSVKQYYDPSWYGIDFMSWVDLASEFVDNMVYKTGETK